MSVRLPRLLLPASTALVALLVLAGLAAPAFAADPPAVTGISPASGVAAGGTAVTISGSGFQGGATVTFNGVAATSVVRVNAATLTAVTPAGSEGFATVVVTNPDGLGASLGGAFRYLGPVPTITSVSPANGPSSGGTVITVTGTGFVAGAQLRLGGVNATNVSVTPAQITGTTPARPPGPTSVQVLNEDGQSATLASGFTYDAAPAPAISSVSPNSGTTGGGTAVTINGTGFVSGATVRFGGVVASNVVVSSATRITAVTPAGSGTVSVQVQNPDGQSAQFNNAYTYTSTATPTVASVSPSTGPVAGGTAVTITGTGFLPGAVVTIGTTNASNIVVHNTTRITATTPATGVSGPVAVRVTNTDGRNGTRTNAFTYTAPLSVTGVSPSSGTTGGGTPITITGTGFVAGAAVRIGGTSATGVQVLNGSTITAVTPGRTGSNLTVQVTNPGGASAQRSNAFTYVSTAAPDVTGVSPASGPINGGNVVTVSGTGFLPGATVTFGSRNASGVTVLSTTHLTVVVPSASSSSGGTVDVRVTNTDGKRDTRNNAYTYAAGPTLTSITPSSGSTAGGTQVTLTGTNFVSGSTVTIGGAPATNVVVTSSTRITARTPARSAGAATVVVQTPGGQVAVLGNGFTYRAAPEVHSISPGTGPTTGGTIVTITGAGFASGATVTVGGVPATQVTVLNSQQITARMPARSAGAAPVQVRAADGALSSGSVNFIYTVPTGAIVGGSIPRSGIGLFVYSGGPSSQLVTLAETAGCPALRVAFFATTGGRFIAMIPGAPAFVNNEWNRHFEGGIPALTALLAACR